MKSEEIVVIIKTQQQLFCTVGRLLLKKQNDLNELEKIVLLFLCDSVNHTHYGDKKWTCFYTQQKLAECIGKSERTVRSAIKVLYDKGYIVYDKGNSYHANVYKIDVERIGVMFNHPMRYATDVKVNSVSIKKTHRANQADKSIWDDDEETLPF